MTDAAAGKPKRNMATHFLRNFGALLTTLPLLAISSGCMFEFSGDIGDCGPDDEDYPNCRPVSSEKEDGITDEGSTDTMPHVEGDKVPTFVSRNYEGSECLSGAGMRIVVGYDNDEDGTLLTDRDGMSCVGVGDSLSGGVGISMCWDPVSCIALGISYDSTTGIGINVCLDRTSCLKLGVSWDDASPFESRLCWDPNSDVSVSSDEILFEGIVCQRPKACLEDGRCPDNLVCNDDDVCVIPPEAPEPEEEDPPDDDCPDGGDACGGGENS